MPCQRTIPRKKPVKYPVILSAQGAQISYAQHDQPVLDGISVRVLPGVLTGVLGPNGSGKSTLVRALSRVLCPQAGDVLLTGADNIQERSLYRDMTARDAAQSIGVVPQSASVQMEWTVQEIVAMGRAPHQSPRLFAPPDARDNTTVAEAMAAAGITELTGRTATELSGGEWQRVLLARALAQDTGVLLLDEPTAHLDLRHQQDVLLLMRRLAHDQNKAVLAVLHDLNLAATYCDYLYVLHDGRVAAEGTPDDVLTPALLWDVYSVRTAILPHPLTGRPTVLTLPPEGEAPDVDARLKETAASWKL